MLPSHRQLALNTNNGLSVERKCVLFFTQGLFLPFPPSCTCDTHTGEGGAGESGDPRGL